MADFKLYVLSLFACRFGREGEPEMVASHLADYTPAKTDEQAIEIGMGFAKRTWPESDGWDGHSVKFYIPKRDVIQRLVSVWADEADEESIKPEDNFIM